MPARSDRPSPQARMVQLLADRKRELLAAGKPLTPREFESAWRDAWAVMTGERAWAHATEHRRGSRTAMLATRSEYRAAFLDRPTGLSRLVNGLSVTCDRQRQDVAARLEEMVINVVRQGFPLTTEDERLAYEQLADQRGGVAA